MIPAGPRNGRRSAWTRCVSSPTGCHGQRESPLTLSGHVDGMGLTLAQRCSFCGEDRRGLDRLVAGHGGVAICADCARLAVELALIPDDEATGDLLLSGIGTLVTNDPRHGGTLGVVHGAAVAVRNGRVTWVGRERAMPDRYRRLPVIECEGRMVAPGFVDAHRHLSADHAIDRAHLTEVVSRQIGALMEQGATTVELRAWGAPGPETDMMLVSAIAAADDALPTDVVAGVVVGTDPPTRGSGYRAMLESVLLPTVSQVAVYLDAVVGGALSTTEAVGVLEAGRRRGLRPRVHVDGGGGLEAALSARAVSVDGMWGMEASAAAVADAGIVMVSLPAASWMQDRPDPAAEMWDRGVVVALGTGCVGGVVPSVPMAMAVAVHHAALTADQALWSATRGGALAVEEPERGIVTLGAVADLVVLEAEHPADVVAEPGRDPVVRVVKDGTPL